MKKQFLKITAILLGMSAPLMAQQDSDHQYARPLSEVLDQISRQFGVRLKTNDVVIDGKILPYADQRIRPYSVEESLNNVLAPFDYKIVKQKDNYYKVKPYEYARRTEADGEKLLAHLSGLYTDRASWEKRKDSLQTEVRQRLGLDPLMAKRVAAKPVYSKIRRFDGYTVRNFYLETLPGLYVCGSVYEPAKKGKHPFILCPNGHFYNGRYGEVQQQRLGNLARMGAVCVDYDLFGWGESELQVGSKAHRRSIAMPMQILNGLTILDEMLKRKDIDLNRVGVNGGSGGGSQTVLLAVLDNRFTVSAPIVSLASHFDGGCPCESGMPVHQAGNGTCNAELAAFVAPKPLLIVSDGGDWTASVPRLEYPYLQRIYGFYDAVGQVSNIHLPTERHDFGINKRTAVYDFFIREFKLDASRNDESRVTIEPIEALCSFGKEGEKLPPNAIRSLDELYD
ncbi:MAG: hypothetical protein RR346_04060 [Bacteroidales bacterium]